jgi:hypothetical protein
MAIGYNPTAVTTGLVLLLDPANPKAYNYQENLFYYSEQIGNNSYYSNTSYYNITTGTSNTYTNAVNPGSVVFSPNGSTTTNIITGISTSQQYAFINQQYNTTFPGVYTFSMYAQPGTTSTITLIHGTNGFYAPNGTSTVYVTVIVNLATTQMTFRGISQNSSNTNSINDFSWGSVPAANGWTRYWVTANLTTSTQYGAYPLGSISSGFYVNLPGGTADSYGKYMYAWGMQLQMNSYLNNYYRTTNSLISPSLTINDLSVNKNNGTLTGAYVYTPYYNGANNGYFNLGLPNYYTSSTFIRPNYNFGYQVGSYISTLMPVSQFATTSNFTISTWFNMGPYYISNPGSQNYTVAGTIAGSMSYDGWGLLWCGNSSTYQISTWVRAQAGSNNLIQGYPGNDNYYSGGYNLNTNTWYNAVMVYNYTAGVQSLYINNTLTGTAGVITGTFNVIDPNFNLGGTYSAGGPSPIAFPGYFGPTQVYNRALSANEISQNFAAYRGRFGV